MSYTYVRLIKDEIRERYEVRVSTFFEFDDNESRRSVTGHPPSSQALEQGNLMDREFEFTREGKRVTTSLTHASVAKLAAVRDQVFEAVSPQKSTTGS